MAEVSVEITGGGFIPGFPGHYANCRAVFDRDTRQLLRIELLGGLIPITSEMPAEQENVVALPIEPDQNAPASQGG